MVHREWREELEQKSSLRLYRMFKGEMREEDHEGGVASRLWFAARTCCLKLECRRWGEESDRCRLCGADREDEEHFILDCGELEEERSLALELQRPRVESRDEVMGGFLFGGDERRKKRVLHEMWKRRDREIRRREGD